MKTLMKVLLLIFVALSRSSNAYADRLQLRVTQPADIGVGINFFVSDSNGWPDVFPHPGPTIAVAGGRGSFNVFVELPADLSNVYISGYGVFEQPSQSTPDVFVVEPASGHVREDWAWAYGPPWGSLADFTPETGLAGDLWIINGPAYYGGWRVGRWELSQVPAVSEIPEPATCLLLGTGVIVAGMRRRFALRS